MLAVTSGGSARAAAGVVSANSRAKAIAALINRRMPSALTFFTIHCIHYPPKRPLVSRGAASARFGT
jgi:hypothetical protein